MKKKSQIIASIDQLRCEDPKKRLASVQSLKEIAVALGPVKVRTQFLPFLAEFVDDQQNIVLELLNQLKDFTAELGGEQHEKTLLPLLINFCKTDQKNETQKSVEIIQLILRKNKDLIVDVIKKLCKTDMNSSKQAAARLISGMIQLVPQNESQLLEIYSGMVFGDNPSYKIIAAKNLCRLLENVKNKEELGKIIQIIYGDSDDLPKIFALDALVNYYPVNNNTTVLKFKSLLVQNNWRINAKICEIIPKAVKVFTKSHFKTTFEASLLKFLTSSESELRCKACQILKPLASVMSEQDIKKSLIPIVKKLATDSVDYVKSSTSENIVCLIEVCSAQTINQELLPIIINFIKSNELAIGIIKNFQILTKKISSDIIQEKILTPLTNQFTTENWRVKCQLIELLNNVINSSLFLNDKLTTMLISLVEDKISAVRQKATQLIVNILCQQSPQWCDSMLVPKLIPMKESPSYVERQILLEIIEKTCEKVSQKTLCDQYRQILLNSLSDKVPNVRLRALKALKNSKKLNDKMFEKYIEKLKSDTDPQIKRLASGLISKE